MSLRNAEIRHRRPRLDRLRHLDPSNEIIRGIRHLAGDVRPPAPHDQRRTHGSRRAPNAGYHVARTAPVHLDRVLAAVGAGAGDCITRLAPLRLLAAPRRRSHRGEADHPAHRSPAHGAPPQYIHNEFVNTGSALMTSANRNIVLSRMPPNAMKRTRPSPTSSNSWCSASWPWRVSRQL